MTIVGDQIFIRIEVKETEDCERHFYDKDIKESTYEERMKEYNTLSKGEIVSMLESVGGFKI